MNAILCLGGCLMVGIAVGGHAGAAYGVGTGLIDGIAAALAIYTLMPYRQQ